MSDEQIVYANRLKEMSVLFVDDQPELLELYKLGMFPDNEMNVITNKSPTAAIDIVRTLDDLAVVVSDYNMPEMLGDEFLRNVHAIKPNVMRILVSGNYGILTTLQGVAHHYVPKPYQPSELREKILKGALDYCVRMYCRK